MGNTTKYFYIFKKIIKTRTILKIVAFFLTLHPPPHDINLTGRIPPGFGWSTIQSDPVTLGTFPTSMEAVPGTFRTPRVR